MGLKWILAFILHCVFLCCVISKVQKCSLPTKWLGIKMVPRLSYGISAVLWCVRLFQDPNWYRARNQVGREGTIPANYVQKREGVKSGGKLSLMPWVLEWIIPVKLSCLCVCGVLHLFLRPYKHFLMQCKRIKCILFFYFFCRIAELFHSEITF